MIEISKRLQQVAHLVQYQTMADIGTDHGYVPIYLFQQQKITHGIACDLNKMPLQRAQENIQKYGADDCIETRLGNGLAPLQPNEVESIVIAGMGGMLICNILQTNIQVVDTAKELILSPQHDIEQVRRFVIGLGFCIDEEILMEEDGKQYHIFRFVKGIETHTDDISLCYGIKLLQRKDTLLWNTLQSEEQKYTKLLSDLQNNDTPSAKKRIAQLQKSKQRIQEAKSWYE